MHCINLFDVLFATTNYHVPYYYYSYHTIIAFIVATTAVITQLESTAIPAPVREPRTTQPGAVAVTPTTPPTSSNAEPSTPTTLEPIDAPVHETPMLEATLVVNDSEIPTYEAVQVPHDDDTPRPWWKRHQKLVYGSVGLLILGAAVAVGLALGLRNTTNDDDSSTAQLSSSSVPSLSAAPTMSFVPTLSPTQSTAPTQDRFFKLQGQGLYMAKLKWICLEGLPPCHRTESS